MKLTPLDIHQKEFRHVLRGYNEEEVDAFLDEVANEFERLFQENIDLKEQVERLQKKLAQYENFEQTLQDTMIAAQKSAEDIQNNAKRAGELIIRDAELKGKEMMQEAASQRQTFETNFAVLKKTADDFRDRFRAILEDYLKKLTEIDKAEAKLPEELLAASAAPEPPAQKAEAASLVQETVLEKQELEQEEEAADLPSEEAIEAAAVETPEVEEEVIEIEDIEGPEVAVFETPAPSEEAAEQPETVEEPSADDVNALKEAMRKLRDEAEAFGVQPDPEAEETPPAMVQEVVPEASPETPSDETSSDIEEIS